MRPSSGPKNTPCSSLLTTLLPSTFTTSSANETFDFDRFRGSLLLFEAFDDDNNIAEYFSFGEDEPPLKLDIVVSDAAATTLFALQHTPVWSSHFEFQVSRIQELQRLWSNKLNGSLISYDTIDPLQKVTTRVVLTKCGLSLNNQYRCR